MRGLAVTDTPPDWVLLEAAKLAGWEDCYVPAMRQNYGVNKAYAAICDLIERCETAAKTERARIADWLDELDRGLRKRKIDAGADIMDTMSSMSLASQISLLIRENEYEQWTAWGKKQ
jgi:hypothetical protein